MYRSVLRVRVIDRADDGLVLLAYVQEGRVGQDDHQREQPEQSHLPSVA